MSEQRDSISKSDEFANAVERAKMIALYEFAYGAGHEINNPLANISARAQTLLRDETQPERRRMLAEITAQAQRAHEMIVDLMLFAKPPRMRPETIDLTSWLPRTLNVLRETASNAGIVWRTKSPEVPCPVVLDPIQAAVAIGEVATNAIQCFNGRPGSIDCDLEFDASCARIRIRDDGPGMDERTRERIFDPFYSGREAGRGLGFGLCKAWRILDDHGGRIEVRSAPGEGCEMTLVWPRR